MLQRLAPGQDDAEKRAADLQSLQLKVMRFADEYAGKVGEPLLQLQFASPDPVERLRAHNWRLQQATSAYTIASGPNPVANALDMVVLATLSRMVMDDTWVNEQYAGRAVPLQEAHRALEPKAWALLDGVLTSDQVSQLRQMIADWRERHPAVRAVAFIHFTDFARSMGISEAEEARKPGSLFAFLGLDPLGKLDPAVREIAQTRQLAERTIYYVQRAPNLLDMQVERMTYQFALLPETQAVFDDMSRVSRAAESAGQLAAVLPGVVSREREAAIRQFMGELYRQQHETLALLTEMRSALKAGTETSRSVGATIQSLDALLGRFDTSSTPPAPSAAPTKPFDIAEYAATIRELGATAQQLQALVMTLDGTAPKVLDASAHLIDRLFLRIVEATLIAVLAIALAIVGIRALHARLAPSGA